MQTLYKKIENLEKAAVPVRRARRGIAEQAVSEVSDLESLISAFGADREGRSLTEAESASRQAYSSAFEREFRQKLLRRPTESERIPGPDVIYHAMTWVLARCFFDSGQLRLAQACMLAEQQGRVPTEAEIDALQKANAKMAQLHRLAGIHTEKELEIFRAQGGK